MRRGLIGVLTILLVFGGLSVAGAKDKTLTGKTVRAVSVPPSSRVMVGAMGNGVDSKKLAANLSFNTSSSAYGFTTGVSEEKGSFKLGVLMADLELAFKAGRKDLAQKAAEALVMGLGELGAPLPLMASAINLNTMISKGIALATIDKVAMPVFKPFIENFIQKEGKMAYLRLGEWVESIRLTYEHRDKKLASNLVKGGAMAEYFLNTLKGASLPQGVINSLKKLAELEKKKELTSKDCRLVYKSANQIFEIMS